MRWHGASARVGAATSPLSSGSRPTLGSAPKGRRATEKTGRGGSAVAKQELAGHVAQRGSPCQPGLRLRRRHCTSSFSHPCRLDILFIRGGRVPSPLPVVGRFRTGAQGRECALSSRAMVRGQLLRNLRRSPEARHRPLLSLYVTHAARWRETAATRGRPFTELGSASPVPERSLLRLRRVGRHWRHGAMPLRARPSRAALRPGGWASGALTPRPRAARAPRNPRLCYCSRQRRLFAPLRWLGSAAPGEAARDPLGSTQPGAAQALAQLRGRGGQPATGGPGRVISSQAPGSAAPLPADRRDRGAPLAARAPGGRVLRQRC
jgi:hypothetical protein